MIINKQGQVVANIAQPTVVFTTKAKYDAWVASLPAPEVEANFIVIKTYELAPGGVYEVATNEDRLALTADQKVNETLYLVLEDNSGWRWNMPETEGASGSWTQLFGGSAFGFEYVITVATEDELETLSAEEKAENIVYIVKENDSIYRCEITEESGVTSYEFIKIGGGTAETSITTESVKVFTEEELPPEGVNPGDLITIENYNYSFTYDEPETGKDPEFYANVGGKKIYLKKYLDPALEAGDYYFDDSGDIVYILATTPAAEEFTMSQQEFDTGIIFGELSRVIKLSAMPEVVKMMVTPDGEVYQPVSDMPTNGTKPIMNRLNGHSGKVEVVVDKYDDLPNANTLTDHQKTFLFYTYSQGSTAHPGVHYWQVVEHNSGTEESPVYTYSYVEVSSNEFEEEVQVFKERGNFPAIPAEGVIYIAKKQGAIYIANPKADFSIDENPESNPYYLTIGTDIQSLVGRIEALENVADDVKVSNRADFPGEGGGAQELVDPKEDVLYVAKDEKKCYVWMPKVGDVPGYYMQVGGDDLINMMPAMTMEAWEALDEDERPDYVNIIPTVDGSGNTTLPLFDGFAYKFTKTGP